MSYIKFMFLGLTRTNQALVSKASSRNDAVSKKPATTFPCAFEFKGDGSRDVSRDTIVIDVAPSTTFQDIVAEINSALPEVKVEDLSPDPEKLGSSSEAKGDGATVRGAAKTSPPPQKKHDALIYFRDTLISSQGAWRKAIESFHKERRLLRKVVFEDYISDALQCIHSSDPDTQNAGLIRLREASTFEELYNSVPEDSVAPMVQLIISKHSDVRLNALVTLWSLAFASTKYCNAVLSSSLVNTMLSNDFMGYVQAKGAEGAALCLAAGGILAALSIRADDCEGQLLQDKRGVILLKNILKAAPVGKDRSAPIYAMQVLIEMAEENTGLTMRRLIDTNSFTQILKPPSKTLSGATPLWQLKLCLLNMFAMRPDELFEAVSPREFLKKLLRLGQTVSQAALDLEHERAHALEEEVAAMDGAGGRRPKNRDSSRSISIDLDASETASKIALEASAACGACLWSLASSGVNALAWKTWTRMMNLKTKLYSQMSDMRLESHMITQTKYRIMTVPLKSP